MSTAERLVDLLTEDLIVEVFLRLPKKSLLRFRRVSKGLCNSIDSPVFKKRYDIFHNSASDFAVMHLEAGRLFSVKFHLPDNLDSAMEKEVIIPQNKLHPNVVGCCKNKDHPSFVGCCKGIVCLVLSPPLTLFPPALESYILLNPFNGTYQKVECRKYRCSMGFGYDCATDDYKIVKLEPAEHGNVRIFDVYSMRSDSWRQVSREFSPGCSADGNGNGIFVEGAMHWLCTNNNKKYKDAYTHIAAFDLETEALRSLVLPSQLVSKAPPKILRDLGGRLCVIDKCFSASSIVWVMEEYGVEASWTPLFNIENDINFIIGYFPVWDNARLLCVRSISRNSRILLWLNTRDDSEDDIQILNLPRQKGRKPTWYETQSWICVRNPLRLRCS